MPETHVIRLRGPWECEALSIAAAATDGADATASPADPSASGPLPAPRRLQMPADWRAMFGPEFRGRVRFRRRFHLPTGLEPQEQVWIVIEGACAGGEFALNGRRLGPLEPSAAIVERDVTELLAADNALEIEADVPPAARRGSANEDAAPPSSEHGSAVECPIGEVRLEIRAAR